MNNLRSRCKHRAWGVSPWSLDNGLEAREVGGRDNFKDCANARVAGYSLSRPVYLGLSPQALRFRPLRGLN